MTSAPCFAVAGVTGEPRSEVFQRISLSPAPKGTYEIRADGLQDGPFEIEIAALSSDGSSEPSKQVEGIISEKEGKLFRLAYDPAPKAQLSVTP